QRLQFADRSFDVVVSLRVIMHTPRWADAVSELCRVSNNLVILDYPSTRSLAAAQSLARRVLQTAGVPTEAYRVFTDRQIDLIFQQNGFRVRGRRRQFVLPIALHK